MSAALRFPVLVMVGGARIVWSGAGVAAVIAVAAVLAANPGGGNPTPTPTPTATSTATPGTANLWVDGNGGTCTRAGSAGAYNDAAACPSFNAAYLASQPGDIALVKAGGYGVQSIDSSTRQSQAQVTIAAAPGETVTLGQLRNAADAVKYAGFTAGYVYNDPDLANDSPPSGAGANRSYDVTMQNVTDTGGFDVGNSERFLWKGGSIGGRHDVPVIQVRGMNQSLGQSSGVTDLTFDGVYVHDATRTDGNVHTECMFAMGVVNLTIRNSVFARCAVYNFSIGTFGGNRHSQNLLVENNVFVASDNLTAGDQSGNSVGNLPSNTWLSPPIFRGNVLGLTVDVAGSGSSYPGGLPRFRGNILNAAGFMNCGDANFAANVMERSGGPCSGNTAGTFASQFVGPITGTVAARNYRLVSGSAARGITSAADMPATDADGCARPASPDAGAYQFGGC